MNSKLLLSLVFLITPRLCNAGFIHPMDFDGSDVQKKEVIEFIKEKVRRDYCDGALDMCDESTLRMMEEQNLSAFKKATQVQDRKIMDRVIKDYCNNTLDMCSYDNLLMMYQENLKASKKELTW